MSIAQAILATCFWCSAAGVGYCYVGYPILIWAAARFRQGRQTPPALADADLPGISLLIAAHNEAGVIESRIQNALALDYPHDRLEVVIASDGSDDGTTEVCGAYAGRIRLLAFPNRRGKAETLNAAIPQLRGDLIVLSDANTAMDGQALRNLARWFVDTSVGAVCGRLILEDPATGGNADGVYWRYETFLKTCEGRLGGPLGANGAIYALRRNLFSPLPPGTIVDDFVMPLTAKLRSGCCIVYDTDAVAREESAPDIRAEFRRRARIGAGAFQSLATLWPLLSPRYGWTALALWSHKVLRWLCPLLLVCALFTAAALAGRPIYRAALIAQVGFYALCIVGSVVPSAGRAFRWLRVFPMFASMNLALLLGLARWFRGNQSGIWSRTARLQESNPAR